MDIKQAIEARHSVRQYTEQPIAEDAVTELQAFVDECNTQSGLNMQLKFGDNKGFSGIRGMLLKNVRNYLAIIGKNDASLEELGGFWGERVVLKATQLGIGSCWFAMGVKKDLLKINKDEKLLIAIALGYAAKEGKAHSSKPLENLYHIEDGSGTPEWFIVGVKAAQLAPTATNQQKFKFTLMENSGVKAESLGGAFSGIDLGIVKCHFEIGAEPQNFTWVK